MSETTLVILSVLLAVVIVVVLAAALIRIRTGLESISEGLATLGAALTGVESEHLRPLEPAVKAINAQFDVILGALPGDRLEGRDRRREEAEMTLEWIGDVVLLVVLLPVVVYLLRGVLRRPTASCPASSRSPRRRRPDRRISTPRHCC